MNTSNVILAAKANSGKSTNNVWVVYTSDNSSDKMYCTSAYKAMRLAFLLKKRLGLNISDNCLARLSQEIAKAKGATAPTVQKVQKPEPAPVEEKPKKKREGASQRLKRQLRQSSTSARLEGVGLSSVAAARS